ncbi:hypothetical protein CHUAL_014218 [Chamberlinius hualienensis]
MLYREASMLSLFKNSETIGCKYYRINHVMN